MYCVEGTIELKKNCFKLKIAITFLYINGNNGLKSNSDDTFLLSHKSASSLPCLYNSITKWCCLVQIQTVNRFLAIILPFTTAN